MEFSTYDAANTLVKARRFISTTSGIYAASLTEHPEQNWAGKVHTHRSSPDQETPVRSKQITELIPGDPAAPFTDRHDNSCCHGA